MVTLKLLQDELAPYRGTLVLDFCRVALLKDVYEGDDDCYWVYYGNLNGRYHGEYHSSCVGGWTPLKGFLPDEAYKKLVDRWNINHDEENQAL